ncbi:hypothetical protein NON20_15365 [Synechocystis sp. B12]|nr:hypothetical protein NON20_15365 [Synechocystis sp. B12]
MLPAMICFPRPIFPFLTVIATVGFCALGPSLRGILPNQAAITPPFIAQEQNSAAAIEQKLLEGFDELESGSPLKAIAIFTQVIDTDDQNADAYNLRG